MGNELSRVANKIGDHPSKCLEVNIDVHRVTPERFFLIPVSPTTMPTPQSLLCVMLNEALSAPSAVHWAWPPVSNVETAFTGVADDRLASPTEASRVLPTVEQTFAHALPRHGDNQGQQAAAVELGHPLTFVAVECPVDCPVGRMPLSFRGDRPAHPPEEEEEDGSIFFDFSADWLESIYQTGGCSVVGYFRYLNLFDLPSNPAEHSSTPAAISRGTAPIVSVIDHYLFKGFCYEARAFMLLESVSFYCKRFASLLDVPRHESDHVRRAEFPVLMRCRIKYLPAVRLLQKLHRVFVGESNGSQGTGYQGGNRARHGYRKGRQAPRVRLTTVAHGEILHVYLSPDLINDVSVRLCDKITTPRIWRLNRTGCVVQSEKGLVPPTPTPFDAIVERHRERWLIENAPFRKHTYKSVGSDGEEGEGGLQSIQQPRSVSGGPDRKTAQIGPLPTRLSLVEADAYGEQSSTPSSTSSGGLSATSAKPRQGLGSSTGNSAASPCSASVAASVQEVEPFLLDTDRWGYSATSVERLTTTDNVACHIRSLRQPTTWLLERSSRSPTRSFCSNSASAGFRFLPGDFVDASVLPIAKPFSGRVAVSGPIQRTVNDYVGHPIFVADCRPEWTSPQRMAGSDTGFLQVGTPVQVNNGDGLWICGYWLEASRPLNLHWFDPTLSDNALLEHHGPIWIRDLAEENRLMTPTSTGKVYVAVAPQVPVRLSPHLDGEAMEVGTLFEQSGAAQWALCRN
jgi:hypothetical protein